MNGTANHLITAADSVKRDKMLTQEQKSEIVRTLWQLAADIKAGRVKLQVEKEIINDEQEIR